MSEPAPHKTDVLILGAGVSGLGVACHLTRSFPSASFTLLEAKGEVGGTWALFKYPGVRSDSDMFTYAYSFAPWTRRDVLASGDQILSYLNKVAADHDISSHIHFNQSAVRASFSSESATWTVVTGSGHRYESRFLVNATGYYDHAEGHMPDFKGLESFRGEVVHPQKWNPSIDYTDKTVIIIGSGATAITMVPAIAGKASHVTMLQRTPSYVAPNPIVVGGWLVDFIWKCTSEGSWLRRLYMKITRVKRIIKQSFTWYLAKAFPNFLKRTLRKLALKSLPEDVVDKHFTPPYNPWDQRICATPNTEFFDTVNRSDVTVVTDTIDQFTPDGIRVSSGDVLEADLVVSATGLKIKLFGGVQLDVDGRWIHPHQTMLYRGVMPSELPNLFNVTGYIAASWTLRVDVISQFVIRVLKEMERQNATIVVPVRKGDEPELPVLELSSGYIARSSHLIPKQSTKAPWRLYQTYHRDRLSFLWGNLCDGVLHYSNP